MSKHKVTEVWKAPDTFSFEGTNQKTGAKETVVLQYYNLTLEDGKVISVGKKPEFEGFETGKEYDFEISQETTKSGKAFKAKHKNYPDLECPCGCGYKGPLEDFRPKKETPVQAAPAPEAPAQAPYNKDNEPPVEGIDSNAWRS